MLVQPTLDTLNRLKLYGMAAALSEQLTQSAAIGLAFDERLALLLDREVVHRDNRRLARLLQLAQLSIGGIKLTCPRCDCEQVLLFPPLLCRQ